MYDIASTVSRVANDTYGHTRRIMPEQPWWDTLESSFHKFPDDFELDLRTELTVDSTAVADYMLRTAGASMLGSLALPASIAPRQIRRDMENIGFYRKHASAADPTKFFKKPNSSRVNMQSSSAGVFRFKPDDGKCELLSFDSPFKTVNPALRESYPKARRNMRAVAQYWRHDDGPRPTICVMADPDWLNRLFFALPWFYEQGYDILLYTLPHHGKRQARLSPFSGHGLFSGACATSTNPWLTRSTISAYSWITWSLAASARSASQVSALEVTHPRCWRRWRTGCTFPYPMYRWPACPT